jgi:DNA-binding transcriptional ArsR family regulator
MKRSTEGLTVARAPDTLNHMVDHSGDRLDAVFHALADPTRRAMLQRLTEGERSVSQLAAPFAMSLAGASKHVRVLEGAGLVRRRVRGRAHLCRLDPGRLREAHRWLAHYERFWNARLDALEALLSDEENRT